MRPRIFVGSSAERLYLAEAVQECLEHKADVTIWNQGVFSPSQYPLDALAQAVSSSDAGIFILAPDDLLRIRRATKRAVRDNVLLEVGLFVGALGRHRSFLIAPRQRGTVRLPSDLEGLGVVNYDARRRDRNWKAALGPACSVILRSVRKVIRPINPIRMERLGFFEEFVGVFDALLPKSRQITTFFIHSRRWRENHSKQLLLMLKKPTSKLTVFLPDPSDEVLSRTFLRNFDDGPFIPGLIEDACRFFAALRKTFGKKVTIRFFKNYPTYSFYVMDNTAVVAMYPNTSFRRPVPTMQVSMKSPIGQFVKADVVKLQKESRKPSTEELNRISSTARRRRRK